METRAPFLSVCFTVFFMEVMIMSKVFDGIRIYSFEKEQWLKDIEQAIALGKRVTAGYCGTLNLWWHKETES